MGETGCGKTSLIRHLAKLLSVNFKCLNVHAGTSAEDIMAFVEGVQVQVVREFWEVEQLGLGFCKPLFKPIFKPIWLQKMYISRWSQRSQHF